MSIIDRLPRAGHRAALVLQKNSPAIMTGVGVVGMVGATVLACRATLNAGDILDEGRDKIRMVKDARALVQQPDWDGSEYTEEQYKTELTISYIQTAVNLGRLYLPAILIGACSITMIIGGQREMWKRNAALATAYQTLHTSFDRYRKRVEENFGREIDRDIWAGVVEESVEETDEEGNTTVETKFDVDPDRASVYSRWFDEYNPHYQNVAEYNLMFLRTTQSQMNDRLKARGHVFLNEVYDALGIKRSPAGAVTGWVYNRETGDDYIDFGLYEDNTTARDFINGWEKRVLLDFNVDGVIYDLI